MDKLKMHSPDMTQDNIAKIRALFPGCVTEAAGADGKLKLAVDFDSLRQELTGSIVEGSQERYHIDWPGKRQALITANAPIAKTLRPFRSESINFETTQNLFIEGDNLEALKLIQETFLKRVKMIYIDPPYNTGSNLIYKNKFYESAEEFLFRSNQANSLGAQLVSNPETNGRYHSDWLSSIYPALRIARTLLADDGVFVCAIDENEFSSISLVLKELFTPSSWEHGYVSVVHNPRGQQGKNFSYVNEYLIFIFPRDQRKHLSDFKKEEIDSRNLRDSGTESDRTDARNCFYPFVVQGGKIIAIGDVPADSFHPSSANVTRTDGSIEVWPISETGEEKKWRYARQSVEAIFDDLEPKGGRSSVQIIFNKRFGTMRSVWTGARYDSSEYGTKLVDKIVDGAAFSFPKSLWAVYDCLFAGTQPDEEQIVLDFFAGSSTTAHATMQLNATDGGKRRFIMVQAPQEIKDDEISNPVIKKAVGRAKKALDALGLPHTIAEISKERIRRAGEQIIAGNVHTNWNKDVGFRVLKIDTSNMADVYYTPDATNQGDLLANVDSIKQGRTAEDLLFQVLVDWGVDLTLPIRRETVQGKTVFFVDENALVACFDTGISEELVKELAGHEPVRVVFKDTGFVSDAVKINVEQIFRQLSPSTDVKAI